MARTIPKNWLDKEGLSLFNHPERFSADDSFRIPDTTNPNNLNQTITEIIKEVRKLAKQASDASNAEGEDFANQIRNLQSQINQLRNQFNGIDSVSNSEFVNLTNTVNQILERLGSFNEFDFRDEIDAIIEQLEGIYSKLDVEVYTDLQPSYYPSQVQLDYEKTNIGSGVTRQDSKVINLANETNAGAMGPQHVNQITNNTSDIAELYDQAWLGVSSSYIPDAQTALSQWIAIKKVEPREGVAIIDDTNGALWKYGEGVNGEDFFKIATGTMGIFTNDSLGGLTGKEEDGFVYWDGSSQGYGKVKGFENKQDKLTGSNTDVVRGNATMASLVAKAVSAGTTITPGTADSIYKINGTGCRLGNGAYDGQVVTFYSSLLNTSNNPDNYSMTVIRYKSSTIGEKAVMVGCQFVQLVYDATRTAWSDQRVFYAESAKSAETASYASNYASGGNIEAEFKDMATMFVQTGNRLTAVEKGFNLSLFNSTTHYLLSPNIFLTAGTGGYLAFLIRIADSTGILQIYLSAGTAFASDVKWRQLTGNNRVTHVSTNTANSNTQFAICFTATVAARMTVVPILANPDWIASGLPFTGLLSYANALGNSVAATNDNTLGGLSASSARTANTIVARDSNGYVLANHLFSQTSLSAYVPPSSETWHPAGYRTSDGLFHPLDPAWFRNRLGLGNTTGALPVANGGTGRTDGSPRNLQSVLFEGAGAGQTVTLTGTTYSIHFTPTANNQPYRLAGGWTGRTIYVYNNSNYYLRILKDVGSDSIMTLPAWGLGIVYFFGDMNNMGRVLQ